LLYCITEIKTAIASAIDFLKLRDFFVGGVKKPHHKVAAFTPIHT
jgi:hypothetical protein